MSLFFVFCFNVEYNYFHYVLIQVSFLTKSSQLTASILEGGAKPFERANGMSIFGHMTKNESIQTQFNEVMLNHTSIVMKKLLKTYNGFESLSDGVLVDVGGGLGANLALILSNFPQLKGVNFDLPHVVSEAPKILGKLLFCTQNHKRFTTIIY